MTTKMIAVRAPEELVKQFDKLAAARFMDRSKLLVMLMTLEVQKSAKEAK